MKVRSVYSNDPEGYDAGLSIGEQLRDISPDIVIIHCTIHYKPFDDFFDGFYDGIGKRDLLLIGATGDGYYHTDEVGTQGIVAMGINGEGKINYCYSIAHNLDGKSFEVSQSCTEELEKNRKESLKFALCYYDGITGDGVSVVEGIRSRTKLPIIGGAAGDERNFIESYVFCNGKAYRNSIVLAGIGGKIAFSIAGRSGWHPIGDAKIVQSTSGKEIITIGDQSAVNYVETQLGSRLKQLDLRLFSLAVYNKKEEFFLRSFIRWNESGWITLAGRIKEGDLVRVAHGTFKTIIHAVDEALQQVQLDQNFNPLGAIVVSCAARKWILQQEIDQERQRLLNILGKPLPIVGFPGYGEISPYQISGDKTCNNYFHNKTYILCLFGEEA